MLKIVLRAAAVIFLISAISCSSVSRFQMSSNAWVEYDRRNDIYKIVWDFKTIHIISPKDSLLIDTVLADIN